MKNISDLLQENKSSQNGLSQAISDAQAKMIVGDDDKTDEMVVPSVEPVQQRLRVAQDKTKEALQDKMKELKEKEIEDQIRKKAEEFGMGYVNLAGIPIAAESLKMLSEAEVAEKQTICFYYAPHRVVRLAMLYREGDDLVERAQQLREEYEGKIKLKIEIYLISQKSFKEAARQHANLPRIREVVHGVQLTEEELNKFSKQLRSLDNLTDLIKEVSTTELVALIVAAGLKSEASDIHIEAEVDGIKLRYRIDGVLHTAGVLEKEKWQQMISRLKLLSGLKLNISDKPQDGRFSIFMKEEKVDVRVSSLPTAYGESVVMRLLLSRATELNLEDLGLDAENFRILDEQIGRPNGMIITTGPTGSGKTTTLYAILNKLNSPETKIITVEDPIEYELTGINQSQVDASRDYTFAKGLRSIVRQDPDIIMVGEMRDLETVDIALNAALTGHLVLSTLHTNDAAGAIPRFLAMGAKPYLLAPALNLIMAQRLVRKLCQECKQEISLDEEAKIKIKEIAGEVNLHDVKFYGPQGCERCNGLGYKGRIGVFELVLMNKEIESVILSNEISEYKIREIAEKNGMKSMTQDGIRKAMKGMTSLEEVFRVLE